MFVIRKDIPTERQKQKPKERMKNGQKNRQTFRQIDGQKDQHTEIPTDRRTDICLYHRVRILASLYTIIKNKMDDIF